MSKTVYLGEDFTVEFDANFDMTGASALIKYRWPSGVITSVSATITDAANGIHSINVADTDLREAGRYRFWSIVTDAAAKKTISAPIDVLVLNEGKK